MKNFFVSAILVTMCNVFLAQTPAFVKTNHVTGLAYPIAFEFAPDGRIFLTLKGGFSAGSCSNARIKVYSATGTFLNDFYNLTDSVQCDFERGLLGLCLDPNFATNNYVYAYYNHIFNGDERIRVVRFTESNNVGTNPTIILDIDVSNSINGNHVGGNIRMHASEPDKIYVSIGDIAVQANGQTLTDPYGSLLRINSDGTIPTDNPFYDDGNPATGNDDRIWTYGHRNAFDLTFSAVNDSLYSSENGLNTWDEVNMITRAKNYGWNTCEGFFNQGSVSTPCSMVGSKLPIEDWGSPLPAVTGILHYSGTQFSTLTNHLLIADNNNGYIYNLTLGNAPTYDTLISRVLWADMTTSGGLTTLQQGSDECIYAMKGGYTSTGAIYKICPTTTSANDVSTVSHVNVFPNPAAEEVSINFNLAFSGVVSAEIYDVTGRKVALTAAQKMSAGDNTLKVSLAGAAKGVLFCTIKISTAAGESKSLPVKLIKE